MAIEMTPGATSGATIDGGDGNDMVIGSDLADTIRGGAGDDDLFGGDGDDRIFGDGGHDWLVGEDGNDTLDGGDGEVDRIACGTGADVLRADTGDVVNQDPSELCESITRVTGSTGGKLTVKLPAKARVSKRGTVAFKVSNGLKKPVLKN